ncbi:hypothetical protein AGABI2DRAFT_185824 [Agaricus bisporus var. bisporus H97]|uniref:hypothetical protein n=1 Tax=Agaricus bisporus var. bisporus (strain H97 / ATCC MYA-4626 / FGSC 10389) TaxID=936046 RepID=UPI00029F6156|nr:hypothetical protein AGABI2DRAFT_185824 [Agaricus bisporus var. bisporus H97]EKV46385.1 hypothetical protein AGABI2DRAFT_185824 [Agaricus bisporus var. bisporus H97]
MDHIFNGTFASSRRSLRWVPEGISFLEHGQQLQYYQWQLSADMSRLLLKADGIKQWRHSNFGNYYVHDIQAKTTYPIIPPTNPSKTAYAAWSPTGSAIAYVIDNDVYILPDASPDTEPIRVTASGNATLFHGVPDWVYEEEVFESDFALWWSPDSNKLAFLAFDETIVPEFSFPVYNPTDDSDAVIPYTTDTVVRYPKPGYPNPLVSVHIFDLGLYLEDSETATFGDLPIEHATLTLDWENRKPANDSIISEIAWVGNATLLVKEVNRNADSGSVIAFNLGAADSDSRTFGRVARKLGKDGEEGDEGWIENHQNIYPLSTSLTTSGANAYFDIVPSPEGYNHIALFSPANSGSPRFLTAGQWEVTSGIKGVDMEKGLIYFEAANPSSIERHIYSVPIPTIDSPDTVEPIALTDTLTPSWYDADFSPKAGFYVLSYNGPQVPWQKVLRTDDTDFELTLTTNERLQNVTREYEAATITRSVFINDDYEFNVKEIRPPRMDDSGRTKYPVLFRVYGGPQSQLVDLKFSRDWHDYLACGLDYIVVIVDGRGTGFKGRELRNPVKGNLGFWETTDQLAAARAWAAKKYVDPTRIGIWGWSYGGFMSSKVAEANAGIHSLAMAVAPVTSWRLYDSIYTERYMNLPDVNPNGYVNASISNVTGFHNIDFLLAHGSGDDNVHFANSAHLLDMFTKARVRRFRFRMFPDSDHGINRRGAYRELYEYMTEFLIEKWGKGGRRRL